MLGCRTLARVLIHRGALLITQHREPPGHELWDLAQLRSGRHLIYDRATGVVREV